MIGEPWNTILFIAVIPLIHQLLKLLADKFGFSLNELGNQILALVLSGVFVFISGGFAGIELPVWKGDLIQFIGQIVLVFGSAWAIIMKLYDFVWDALYKKAKFVTEDER